MDQLNFPPNFLQSLMGEPGFDEQNFTNVHQFTEAPTSIRLNPFKKASIKTDGQVPCVRGWLLFGYAPLIHFRPAIPCRLLLCAGGIEHVHWPYIKYNKAGWGSLVKILDLCAAPGGKSTLLNAAMNADDLLVANEIIKTRVPILTDNLSRWGTANTIVTNNDPRDFSRLKGFFDIILVDAPCSGSGMFRKDPAAMNEWSEDNVNLCHQRQERILADIYPCLKEDGYLIYSTCSYSHQENEDILDWLCDEFEFKSLQVATDKECGDSGNSFAIAKGMGISFLSGQGKRGRFVRRLFTKDGRTGSNGWL